MLRVGLTGGLGSGKSTAAKMFAAHGAYVLSADEIGRTLMQPGQAVFAAVVAHFGQAMLAADGTLDRAALAKIAFGDGRVEELNAIVHPAVIAWQAERVQAIGAQDAVAVVLVETALLFETKHGGEGGWHTRFDRVVFVQAPREMQISRFVERTANGRALEAEERAQLAGEAQRRLAQQMDDAGKAAMCDFVLTNDGSLEHLQAQVDAVWPALENEARRERSAG